MQVRTTAQGRRRPLPVIAASVLVLFGLSACRDATAASPASVTSATSTATPVSEAKVTASPVAGAKNVRPTTPVVVSATKGTLTAVHVVDAKGRGLVGTLDATKHTWTASKLLRFDTPYVITATAVDKAKVATTFTSSFQTLKPKAKLHTSVSPLRGSTVGVGMPIIVTLSAPVTDRAAVEKALVVQNSAGVEGRWSWKSPTQLQYRPQDYWPADTRITFDVKLTGVDAGKNVWGDETRTIAFRTGSAMISTVDVKAKRLTVTRNGKVLRVIPVTTGKAGFLTRGGIKVISEKYRSKIMDAATGGTSKDSPDYYRLKVQYALRVTWSGEFLHAAPWSVHSQGQVNVSHGCVGMSMADGKWFYDQSKIGDVVKVVNSSRKLEDGNGWTAWNIPWSTWVAGSAL